uniref:Protein kinase domain-containing protein n=1 Tax=Meloidogyne incognita TaxID=6306 RepID=A0A914MU38_MELIC
MEKLEDTSSKDNFILKILKGATISIKQLHDKDIIHLDIKLDNFVLGYKSNQTQIVTRPVINLKLIDFNSSVINGMYIDRVQLTTMNSVLKPPELEENDIENLSKSADIWAFGLMSYEIVHGELPNERSDLLEALESYRNNHSYNSRLDSLIKLCIAVDPNERPDIDQTLYGINEILKPEQGHQ